jgi:hypothetical protein
MATPRGTSAVALSPRQPSGQNVGNNLFKSFTAKKYAEQAQAFLNAYWGEHEKGSLESCPLFLWSKSLSALCL